GQSSCGKGQWDLDALKIEFEELIVIDAPLEIAGFSPGEIDHVILGDGTAGLEEGPLEPDPSVAAIAKLGDVFQLGSHRIVCGSATDPGTLRRLAKTFHARSGRAHQAPRLRAGGGERFPRGERFRLPGPRHRPAAIDLLRRSDREWRTRPASS